MYILRLILVIGILFITTAYLHENFGPIGQITLESSEKAQSPEMKEISRDIVATTTPFIEKPKATTTPITQKPTISPPTIKPTMVPVNQQISKSTPTPKIVNTEEMYAKYHLAVLNIWCQGPTTLNTGTAVIIHPSGILLTNAHVVKDVDIDTCTLRTWNPFAIVGKFKVIYIPDQTPTIINTNNLPRNDFALLQITETNRDPNDPWPTIPFSIRIPEKDENFFIFSFATEFLGFDAALRGIPLVYSTMKSIGRVTLDPNEDTAEGLALEGSIASQQGGSGSPIIDFDQQMTSILTLVTKADTTAERKSVSILISHINLVMLKETGFSLKEYIDTAAALK